MQTNAEKQAATAAAIAACRGLRAEITSATSYGDRAGNVPGWLRFILSDELIDRILAMSDLCKQHHLFRCAESNAPELGPGVEGGEVRTDFDVMLVYDDMFCFNARERYSETEFESQCFWFDSFFAEVAAGRRFFSGDGDEADKELEAQVREDEAAGGNGAADDAEEVGHG